MTLSIETGSTFRFIPRVKILSISNGMLAYVREGQKTSQKISVKDIKEFSVIPVLDDDKESFYNETVKREEIEVGS